MFKTLTILSTLFFSTLSIGTIRSELFDLKLQNLLNLEDIKGDYVIVSQSRPFLKPRISFLTEEQKNKETYCFSETKFKDLTTGEEFTTFATGDDDCDGGITIGWVENSQKQKIGEIDNSEIDRCTQKEYDDLTCVEFK